MPKINHHVTDGGGKDGATAGPFYLMVRGISFPRMKAAARLPPPSLLLIPPSIHPDINTVVPTGAVPLCLYHLISTCTHCHLLITTATPRPLGRSHTEMGAKNGATAKRWELSESRLPLPLSLHSSSQYQSDSNHTQPKQTQPLLHLHATHPHNFCGTPERECLILPGTACCQLPICPSGCGEDLIWRERGSLWERERQREEES